MGQRMNRQRPTRRVREFVSRLIGVLLCIVLAVAAQGAATPCDSELTPIDDMALRYRSRDHRCEGFYVADVSSGSRLEIVGLTQGEFFFSREEDMAIELDCPWAHDKAVQVRATGIPSGLYYQMDALLPPGETFTWPLEEVVHREGVPASEIGVLAWLLDPEAVSEERIFVPVRRLTESPQSPSQSVALLLRSHEDVEAVQWRMKIAVDREYGPMGKWSMAIEGVCSAGRGIQVDLPAQEAHEAFVEVAARIDGTATWIGWTGKLILGEASPER